MSTPGSVTASVIEIGGTSCGTLHARMDFDSTSQPPEYYLVSGDFAYARLWQVDLGGGSVTWQLKVYVGSGQCAGLHSFRLTTPAASPLGDYCLWDGSSTNCDKGQAAVIEA